MEDEEPTNRKGLQSKEKMKENPLKSRLGCHFMPAFQAILLRKSIPLVIVDEAHHWKNGPLRGANGYRGFVNTIAARTRRALLLTATPFQLRPNEMLEILKIADHLKFSSDKTIYKERRQNLEQHRENVIRPVLNNSSSASKSFTKAWQRLPATVAPQLLEKIWESDTLAQARNALREIAIAPKRLPMPRSNRSLVR